MKNISMANIEIKNGDRKTHLFKADVKLIVGIKTILNIVSAVCENRIKNVERVLSDIQQHLEEVETGDNKIYEFKTSGLKTDACFTIKLHIDW